LFSKDENGAYYEFYNEDYTPNFTKIDKAKLNKLITSGEHQVDSHIQNAIDIYNLTNGVKFKDINSIPKYLNDNTYEHYAFCVAIINFNKDCWIVSRQVQKDILSGAISIPTADEFGAMLPIFTM